jgi:hypothetical protein
MINWRLTATSSISKRKKKKTPAGRSDAGISAVSGESNRPKRATCPVSGWSHRSRRGHAIGCADACSGQFFDNLIKSLD